MTCSHDSVGICFGATFGKALLLGSKVLRYGDLLISQIKHFIAQLQGFVYVDNNSSQCAERLDLLS